MNSTPHINRSKILADLRSLRESLAHARSLLMHYKDDRVDRDKLESAARRVDDLMLMFAGAGPDLARGSTWVTEVQMGIDRVNNPKSTEALHSARNDTESLLVAMAPGIGSARAKAS